MKKDKDFDDIFKKGLGDAGGPAYREEDWNAFAQMLATPKKKLGLIFWIPVLSGAAILLIAFGWWILTLNNAQNDAGKIQARIKVREQTLSGDTIKPVLATRKDVGTADRHDSAAAQRNTANIYARSSKRKDVGTADKNDSIAHQRNNQQTYARLSKRKDVGTADRNDSIVSTKNSPQAYARVLKQKDASNADRSDINSNEKMAKNRYKKDTVHWRNATNVSGSDLLAANGENGSIRPHRTHKPKNNINSSLKNNKTDEDSNNIYATNGTINEARDTVNLTAYNTGLTLGDYLDLQNASSLQILAKTVSTKPSLLPIKRYKPVVKSGSLRPQYALSVLGAPEVNGVNSLSQTSSGTNLGVLFSVELFNKLFISTGAMYSVKPYNSNVENYAYNASYASRNITSINANCHVLDIPLNLDYQFYNKHLNKLSVGTGLSSYIMLYEHYQYNYGDPTVEGPYSKTIPQTNKYLFGVLNLQAIYTRQVTGNVGISLQPYMKLPLTGIGATGAKLQTAGFAIGLNWNLRSITNP